ncbi:MAG TPA: GDP-mannose 4,6-dehydratase [Firmicutes bacterium]|nr:GDP-mannose 4,6-dehydratase [Bacillota bacterium]HBE07353.1 GDP-mannose 4,6-dehydratase [Bacillota bacterium]HBG44671.1 GDP-mannose 4,6-dehydratase [Bacillota bacterium]HBL49098.1 GDP-mannose 4,6-dehydratase [Bacillota bacterium]HBL69042.1 GDP-mannose 4,6-dehydratase [Bacillota bacterium]
MKKALITGITGFVGSHLAELLLGTDNWEVYGTVRWRSKRENIEHLSEIKLVECELRDSVSVERTILQVQPDYIFHLAAQSFVPTSWNAPSDTLSNNILGQLNILEAVRRAGIQPKIMVACSSEEYGLVMPDETPITEDNPLRPLSPYGVSKVAQDLLGYQYFRSYGMQIVRTRAFNHTGPRRGHVFVCSDFAKQIAEIEKGLHAPIIFTGNLEAQRDFTDVRDMVRGYLLALEQGEPGEVYQLCSGKALAISELLSLLLSMTDVAIEIRQDPARLRPSDVPILLGSYAKFHKQTGWEPQIPFKQTMADLLNYWRVRT